MKNRGRGNGGPGNGDQGNGGPGNDTLLILGLGNVLCGDDGLGVAAVAEIQRRYFLSPSVRVLDGGTLGLTLLGYVGLAQDVLLVDAVRADAPPGTLVRLEGDEVAPAARERLSVHQIGVADLLDGLRLLEAVPRRLLLLGLVPRTLELGLERSPEVERQLPALVREVIAEAKRLGYELRRRPDQETDHETTWPDSRSRSGSAVPRSSVALGL
jgi:hydrogenase maturation protease